MHRVWHCWKMHERCLRAQSCSVYFLRALVRWSSIQWCCIFPRRRQRDLVFLFCFFSASNKLKWWRKGRGSEWRKPSQCDIFSISAASGFRPEGFSPTSYGMSFRCWWVVLYDDGSFLDYLQPTVDDGFTFVQLHRTTAPKLNIWEGSVKSWSVAV